MAQVSVLASGRAFLEGPRWHDGTLYVSDMRRVIAELSSFAPYEVNDMGGRPTWSRIRRPVPGRHAIARAR